ncbi:winged helix-turn-helix transcriptional regulator [Caenimonas aquaedulcis]|uniref:Helix-turn-helix transcriptional regulator n=1 Tax=Caenimonas aquaedulcis TaxID=2793270 RepID=A0A931H0Y7_9BURK|nr:helix-turn-helix domain-containing protein [Caenimonas aquaedulcis]MBG9386559.1 helix-turn-helix transcriptional regulator [Caenimonas aquaedulcis]
MKASPPLPGKPVRGSRTGRPVMALLDLLGRRGSLRLLWELRDGHPQSFRVLRAGADDMSPSVLNSRLKELRAAQVVALSGAGYALTSEGKALIRVLKPLQRWADGWTAHAAHGDAAKLS